MKLSDFSLIIEAALSGKNISKYNVIKFIKHSEKKTATEANVVLNKHMQKANDETELPLKFFWILIVRSIFELLVTSGDCVGAMKYRDEYRKEKKYLKNN